MHFSGTGKTYIGLRIIEALLANTSQWPILIVCYTNHALDQFLEGVLQFCNDDELIRIGGKSQCEALQNMNMASIRSKMKSKREVPAYVHLGRSENNSELKRIQKQISDLENEIAHLHSAVLGDQLKEVILTCNPLHYHQLEQLACGGNFNEGILCWLEHGIRMESDKYAPAVYGIRSHNNNFYHATQGAIREPEYEEEEIRKMERERLIDMSSDEEEDKKVGNSFKRTNRITQPTNGPMACGYNNNNSLRPFPTERNSIMSCFKREMRRSETMSQEQAAAVGDINALLPQFRWNLYRLWINLYTQEVDTRIKGLREAYKDERIKFNVLRNLEDIEIVKKAKIIGMTTTGAAKYRHIIDGVKPKIISK